MWFAIVAETGQRCNLIFWTKCIFQASCICPAATRNICTFRFIISDQIETFYSWSSAMFDLASFWKRGPCANSKFPWNLLSAWTLSDCKSKTFAHKWPSLSATGSWLGLIHLPDIALGRTTDHHLRLGSFPFHPYTSSLHEYLISLKAALAHSSFGDLFCPAHMALFNKILSLNFDIRRLPNIVQQ